MLDKINRYAMIYDFYGELLTKKQQEFFELYYHQDWSLGEIAKYFGISRAAVYDLLKRTEKQLDNYEGKLKLGERFKEIDDKLNNLLSLVDSMNSGASSEEIGSLRKIIENIIVLTRD